MPAPDPLTRRKRKGKELDEGTIKRLREEELNKTPEERSHWHYNIICICVCVCVCVSMTSERGGRRGRGGEKKRKRGIFFHLLQIEWSCDPSTEYPLLWAANDEREGHVRVSEEDGKKNLKQRLLPCKASLRPPLFDFCNDWTFFREDGFLSM